MTDITPAQTPPAHFEDQVDRLGVMLALAGFWLILAVAGYLMLAG